MLVCILGEQLGTIMYSLTWHLERLSWEKEKALKANNGLTPCSSAPQLKPDNNGAIAIGQYVVPLALPESETNSRVCIDTSTGEQLSCRVYDLKLFQSKADLFFSGTKGVHCIREVAVAGDYVYVFSDLTHGDLHQYLRDKKKLTEVQAAPLFQQIVELIKDAHSRGIALRDIKLKKFVFEDAER